MRYMTGEKDLIKKYTGKVYGKDLLTPQDIAKLHEVSNRIKTFHTSSKSAIGKLTGMIAGGLLARNKMKNNDNKNTATLLGGIGGNIIGGKAENLFRTKLLKLHLK